MNNSLIEELYKTIEAKDNIINNQTLELAKLKSKCEILEENNNLLIQQKAQMYEDLDIAYEKIDNAIEYIKPYRVIDKKYWLEFTIENKMELLELLGEKENE